MRLAQRWKLFLLFSLSIPLLACAVQQVPMVEVQLTTASHLNPNIYGEASPLLVSIYELRSPGAFNDSDFLPLYQQATKALSHDLIDKHTVTVSPAQFYQWQRQLSPETRYLGIVAAFRDLENAKWRSVLSVPNQRLAQLDISVGSQTIVAKID